MKRIIKPHQIIGVLLLLGLPSWANAQATNSANLIEGFSNEAVLIFALGFTLTVLLSIFAVLAATVYALLGQVATEKAVSTEEATPFWTWFWEKFNAAKPQSMEKDILLDHEYDGIHELDNNLPPWWKYGFYASIVFSVIYLWVYHFSDESGQAVSVQEYYAELEVAEAQKAAYLARMESMIDETNVTALADAGELSEGKDIYMQNCRACHGGAGEGGVGPNLTDVYWLHGGSMGDVFSIVKYGVPEKGMLSWKEKLTPKQMQQVSSFIMTLQGTNPANGKEPQGTKYTAEEAQPAKSEDKDDALSSL